MKPMLAVGLSVMCALAPAAWADESPFSPERWSFRFDMGGTMAANPTLTEFGGPITQGGELELGPGAGFGLAGGFRITPWLKLEGEFGMYYNHIDRVGDWSYPDSGLSQILFMANLVVEQPIGRFVPFAGAGIGGDWSYISFGSGYGCYWDWEPDGEGDDFVLAYQFFGGIRYRVSDNSSFGVMYRYFATDEQNWNVDWWSGPGFKLGADKIQVHSVSLVFSVNF